MPALILLFVIINKLDFLTKVLSLCYNLIVVFIVYRKDI